MFGVTDYGAFVAAFVLLLMLPGPGNLALISATAKGGLRGGLTATLGIILGDQVLLGLAIAGVATLLAASPMAFQGVQWLGCGYLVWLGLRMLGSRPGGPAAFALQPGHYLRQALLITLLNPKAIIFYMAFFPLFIDPQRHLGWLTFAFMALTIALLTLCYGLIASLLCQRLAQRLRARPWLGCWLERLAGVLLIGFGVRLVLAR
jgi:leucine efflux protein